MNALLEWYESQPEREQKLIQILAPVIVVLMLIFAVILPLENLVNKKQNEVERTREAVILLLQQQPQGQTSNKKQVTSLTNIVTNTSRQMGFKLDRFEEKKDGEINLWFDRIGFDKMVAWLARLENEYGITASYVSVSQTSDQGVVRANLRLLAE